MKSDPAPPVVRPLPAELLQVAVRFTATQTGFAAQLIEKDYFCSLILAALYSTSGHSLVFKGGTCLSKVYARFYRLSEDLDFVVPVSPDATRTDRRREIEPIKALVSTLPQMIPGIRVAEPLRGFNVSTQYIAVLEYSSTITEAPGEVKLEIGLREALMREPSSMAVQTLLVDPLRKAPALPPFTARCMGMQEAYAEKMRAALSRREPAIRDFFDLDYAVRELGLKCLGHEFIALVTGKLAVRGNSPVDVSSERLRLLRQQVDASLKPVLRPADLAQFDLERVFSLACCVAGRIAT